MGLLGHLYAPCHPPLAPPTGGASGGPLTDCLHPMSSCDITISLLIVLPPTAHVSCHRLQRFPCLSGKILKKEIKIFKFSAQSKFPVSYPFWGVIFYCCSQIWAWNRDFSQQKRHPCKHSFIGQMKEGYQLYNSFSNTWKFFAYFFQSRWERATMNST